MVISRFNNADNKLIYADTPSGFQIPVINQSSYISKQMVMKQNNRNAVMNS